MNRSRIGTSPTSLFTVVAAGHETTASAMAWAIERLRRHPGLLSRLTDEVDAGGSELRQATNWEVLRTRPVIDGATRLTKERIRLGEWVIENMPIIVSIERRIRQKRVFPTRRRSTRIDSSARSRSPSRGFRSAEESIVVSARR